MDLVEDTIFLSKVGSVRLKDEVMISLQVIAESWHKLGLSCLDGGRSRTAFPSLEFGPLVHLGQKCG